MHCYHNVLGWYSSFLPVCNSMKSACLEVTYSWLCMYQYLQVSYDNKPEWLQPSQLPLPSELTGWSTVGQVQCLCMYMPVCTGLYVIVLVYVHASMYRSISVLVYVHASMYRPICSCVGVCTCQYVLTYICVGVCTCQYLYQWCK